MEQDHIDVAGGIKRSKLFNVWRNERDGTKKLDAVLNYIMNSTNIDRYDDELKNLMVQKITNFCAKLLSKWKKANRCTKTLIRKDKQWLDGLFSLGVPHLVDENSQVEPTRGRPRKEFGECSQSSKRRKLQDLVQQCTTEELSLATQMSLRANRKRDAANIVKRVSSPSASPRRATLVKQRLTTPENLPIKITKERALAVFVDNKFTKEQYIDVQHTTKVHNANIFPPYNTLLEAKKDCYPHGIEITEISGIVPLQNLVDHTITRLAISLKDLLSSQIEQNDLTDLKVLFKWGCDGASGHSRYHQAFHDSNNDDSYLFLVMMAPVRIVAGNKILWHNPAPSSTNYCRPIKIVFHKETADFVKQQVTDVTAQIERLSSTEVNIDEQRYVFSSILALTMVDGKTVSTLSGTANQNCHVCGATPKMMNKLQVVRSRPIKMESIQLGMSSLHAWIKCLECILHISYRLDIKKWSVNKNNKASVDVRKKEIQERLKNEMHILVDLPKQGYGSSNTGNVARTFFSNPAKAAQITGVNEELISRIAVILRTICSGYAIDIAAFEKYADETAELYVREYNWYYMPQSIHKILIHGSLIIKEAIMPIGILSEEAQEGRNKDVRNYREFHARKFSRKENVQDILNMLLISSDPLITSMRRAKSKPKGSIPENILALLKKPDESES